MLHEAETFIDASKSTIDNFTFPIICIDMSLITFVAVLAFVQSAAAFIGNNGQ